jgi:hypothetical protein
MLRRDEPRRVHLQVLQPMPCTRSKNVTRQHGREDSDASRVSPHRPLQESLPLFVFNPTSGSGGPSEQIRASNSMAAFVVACMNGPSSLPCSRWSSLPSWPLEAVIEAGSGPSHQFSIGDPVSLHRRLQARRARHRSFVCAIKGDGALFLSSRLKKSAGLKPARS